MSDISALIKAKEQGYVVRNGQLRRVIDGHARPAQVQSGLTSGTLGTNAVPAGGGMSSSVATAQTWGDTFKRSPWASNILAGQPGVAAPAPVAANPSLNGMWARSFASGPLGLPPASFGMGAPAAPPSPLQQKPEPFSAQLDRLATSAPTTTRVGQFGTRTNFATGGALISSPYGEARRYNWKTASTPAPSTSFGWGSAFQG